MNIIPITKELIETRMPHIFKESQKVLGNHHITYFAYEDEGVSFVAKAIGKGIIYTKDGQKILFQTGMTKDLYSLEKNGIILMPSINYGDDDIHIKTSPSCQIGRIHSTLDVSQTNSKSFYKNKVLFTQYNKDNDILCSTTYEYGDSTLKLYPGLLTRIETVQFNHQYSKKGGHISTGILPSNIEVYLKTSISKNCWYTYLLSLAEHGLLKTATAGIDELYQENEITRYVQIRYMNRNKKMIELPWPLNSYYKEENLRTYAEELGFRLMVNQELLSLYNNDNQDINTTKELLPKLEKAQKIKELHYYLK